jgi:hypothetical protein
VTLGAWLRERSPEPPARLSSRVEERLGADLDAAAAQAAPLCVAAAERLLAELLRRASTGRESALDLLAVDALVTYALEAAAASPESIERVSTDAMLRLAAVGLA